VCRLLVKKSTSVFKVVKRGVAVLKATEKIQSNTSTKITWKMACEMTR
jgi:hypothetical protein